MMGLDYEVTSEVLRVDFSATGVNEIIQNVRMILATLQFSCPMDREFAWTPSLDAPINVAKVKMAAQIVEAIRKYEPRAQVIQVSFQGDGLNGVLKPVVKVRVADDAV